MVLLFIMFLIFLNPWGSYSTDKKKSAIQKRITLGPSLKNKKSLILKIFFFIFAAFCLPLTPKQFNYWPKLFFYKVSWVCCDYLLQAAIIFVWICIGTAKLSWIQDDHKINGKMLLFNAVVAIVTWIFHVFLFIIIVYTSSNFRKTPSNQ